MIQQQKLPPQRFFTLQAALTLHLSILIFSGCTNSLIPASILLSHLTGTSTTASPSPTANSGSQIYISSVTPAAPAAGAAAAPPNVSIFIDSSKSIAPISNYCNTVATGGAQTSEPCSCQFTWNESNPNSGTTIASPRQVLTTISSIQSYLVSCPAPSVWSSEIVKGTQINISIVPSPTNPFINTFKVNPFAYVSSGTSTAGSFQDIQGNIYDNILRYSCYQQFMRGMSIQSKSASQTQATSGVTVNYLYASQFCVSTGAGNAAAVQGCSPPPPDYSSQANYFNLYVRNSESGSINQFNTSFTCPQIKEGLHSTSNIGTQNQFWPLDSTFALSLGATTNFTVGVVANTQLSVTSDAVNVSNSCYPAGAGTNAGTNGGRPAAAAGPFVSSCLGFAAAPNTNGSCPSIKDSTNQIRPTYRLRRYVALYPRIFDSNGQPFPGMNQGLDSIYVLDRPVTTPDSTKPATIAGPKPCPFAYFDRKRVTQVNLTGVDATLPAGYYATNNTGWNGKNVDGIEFPNLDAISDPVVGPSCSAALPILSTDRTQITIQTVNKYNDPTRNAGARKHAYIRPSNAFVPFYEEDTRFQACAPQASPFQDPPLHFARDPVTTNVAWCAEVYPTQNDDISNLDPAVSTGNPPSPPNGTVVPFTSHVVKNSASSPCSATGITIPSNYPVGFGLDAKGNQIGTAKHPASLPWDTSTSTQNASQTCDRTVIIQGAQPSWPRFPLLAKPSDVEAALISAASTANYQCVINYDQFGTKGSLSQSPSTGCCDPNSVFVSPKSTPTAAHLEPGIPCKVPTY